MRRTVESTNPPVVVLQGSTRQLSLVRWVVAEIQIMKKRRRLSKFKFKLKRTELLIKVTCVGAPKSLIDFKVR